ncbi:MAG TPA: formate dehydrogenase accessory sulfurtransferase FdhD [Thermoanaerobaculia bacterium]|nr:formate dehydrogenase accessory sulfurtransferase FdhD [Thermoanaerobaculia bacterium]
MSRQPDPAVELWPTTFLGEGGGERLEDCVVVEEPLEIRVAAAAADSAEPFTVTMRTPGHDRELAAGLLYAEGLIASADDLLGLEEVRDPERPLEARIDARLGPAAAGAAAASRRSLLASSACGVCGKAAIDTVLAMGFPAPPPGPRVAASLLGGLPAAMRAGQRLFARTGGIHAAALFDPDGELLLLREDVGRHNAVDKVVGSLLLDRRLPAGESILVVSGRIGFEIVQKALRGGVPLLAAVGAPTSLALRLASRGGMTVAGFLRPGRLNVYCGGDRVVS